MCVTPNFPCIPLVCSIKSVVLQRLGSLGAFSIDKSHARGGENSRIYLLLYYLPTSLFTKVVIGRLEYIRVNIYLFLWDDGRIANV